MASPLQALGLRGNPRLLTIMLFLQPLVTRSEENNLEDRGNLRPTHQSPEGNHRLPPFHPAALDTACEVRDPRNLHFEYTKQIYRLLLLASYSSIQKTLNLQLFLPIPWASYQCNSTVCILPFASLTEAMPFTFRQ